MATVKGATEAMNTTLKNWTANMLQGLGLHRVLRYVNRQKAAVLMYHGVVDNDEENVPPWMITQEQFRWQMEYVARHYQVLPLPHVVDCLLARRPLPPYSVVITFDDGFRNTYTTAYPILKELGLPATIFLVTGYVDSDRALWPDVLFQAIYRTEVEALDLSDLGAGVHQIKTLRDRRATFLDLLNQVKSLPIERKDKWLRKIIQRLQVDFGQIFHDPPVPFALLHREEIREMAREGLISFGVHTETHEILTRLPLTGARWEIGVSKRKLEALLGEQARFFAYPNGEENDHNDAIKQELKNQGFTCAFLSTGGLTGPDLDAFELERLGISPEMNKAYFKLKLSGLMAAAKGIEAFLMQEGSVDPGDGCLPSTLMESNAR